MGQGETELKIMSKGNERPRGSGKEGKAKSRTPKEKMESLCLKS